MIEPLHLTIDGVERYARVRTGPQLPKAIDVILHGGGGAPGASARMAKRWAAAPDRIDVFPEGSPSEPGSVGWRYPEEVHGRPADESDAQFLHALLRELADRYPGLPVRLVGYSAGAGMLQALVRWAPLPVPPASWALLKNTPVEQWIDGGRFEAPFGLPPRLAVWWATGDTTARQDELGHVDAETMWSVWAETYDAHEAPRLSRVGCGRVPVELAEHPRLLFATELGGSHALLPCTGRIVDRWLGSP